MSFFSLQAACLLFLTSIVACKNGGISSSDLRADTSKQHTSGTANGVPSIEKLEEFYQTRALMEIAVPDWEGMGKIVSEDPGALEAKLSKAGASMELPAGEDGKFAKAFVVSHVMRAYVAREGQTALAEVWQQPEKLTAFLSRMHSTPGMSEVEGDILCFLWRFADHRPLPGLDDENKRIIAGELRERLEQMIADKIAHASGPERERN